MSEMQLNINVKAPKFDPNKFKKENKTKTGKKEKGN